MVGMDIPDAHSVTSSTIIDSNLTYRNTLGAQFSLRC